MNRREILGIVRAATVATVAGVTMAAEVPQAGRHDMHQMAAGHEHHGAGSRYADLVAATSHCVTAGDACLSHRLTLLGKGEKDLAACAKTVRDTIAACTALRELAAADSPHVKDLANVVSSICSDCEAECKKHRSIRSVRTARRPATIAKTSATGYLQPPDLMTRSVSITAGSRANDWRVDVRPLLGAFG